MEKNGMPLHDVIAAVFWFEQMVPETGLNQAQINRYGIKSGQDSKRMTYWKNRSEVPTNQSVGRLTGAAPRAARFYRTAPYRLLDPSPLTVTKIWDLMSPYHDGKNDSAYDFGDACFGLSNSECGPPCKRRQAIILTYRGDIYAFFAILALVREAETLGNTANHLLCIQCLYYCLASLGRFAWLRKDYGLLCKAVRRVHLLVRDSALSIGVNWDIIEGQFLDPEHEPDMSKRRLDAETGFPVAIANPTFLMRPAERGTIPAWPYVTNVGESQQVRHDTQPAGCESEQDTKMDESLFFAFILIMRDWAADRHDWEAFLACHSGQPTVWLDIGMDSMTKISRDRILNILEIHNILLSEADDRCDLADAFRAPRSKLHGDSVRERLRSGRVLETRRQLEACR